VQKQLRTQNEDLQRKVAAIMQSIGAASVPQQLEPYRRWLQELVRGLDLQIERNLINLTRSGVDILPEVLDQTSIVTREVFLLTDRYLGPLLRAQNTDSLSLKLLAWMHSEHAKTCDLPVAFADGSFGSWPVESLPTLYVIPPGDQERLLHLPLCFHEFGHLLYACHRSEMDDLVKDLQQVIARRLEPVSRRDDKQAQREQQRRKQIAERWYDWTQEFFCDAVGLAMCGPAFAHSFSFYFRAIGQDAYQRSFVEQMHSSHPVTWLRVRLLADRARTMGWKDLADEIENDWQNIAAMLGVDEDYFGCYDDALRPDLQRTIDDMLTEAEPTCASADEINYAGPVTSFTTPAAILNLAWRTLEADSSNYAGWEAHAVSEWMK
jgi:hypothetical protein